MRQIDKVREPRELSDYKRQQGAIYDGPNFTSVKERIRDSLLAEQGFLCAYCMCRITAVTMKIEHWACQHSHATMQLDYNNLLACCIGHEGNPPKEQTCDTRKGGNNIKYSPAIHAHRINDIIKYDNQGGIMSTDIEFDKHLNTHLNLNKPRLKQNRLTVIKLIQQKLNQKIGMRRSPEIQKMIDVFLSKDINGSLTEYFGIAIFYLNKKL